MKKRLRHNEYYDMQEIFDNLYSNSKNNNNFYNLMEIIMLEDNIKLAYRNIKKNHGSKTAGIDGKTIEDIEKLPIEKFIKIIQNKMTVLQHNSLFGNIKLAIIIANIITFIKK